MAWFNALDLSENAILLTFAVLIALVGAGGVILFYRAIDLAFTIAFGWTGDVLGPGVRAFYRPLITALGMAAAWALMHSLRGREGGENLAALQLAAARRPHPRAAGTCPHDRQRRDAGCRRLGGERGSRLRAGRHGGVPPGTALSLRP